MNVTFCYDNDDTVCVKLTTTYDIDKENKPLIENLNIYVESDFKLNPLELSYVKFHSYNRLHYNITELNNKISEINILFKAHAISEIDTRSPSEYGKFKIKVEYLNKVFPLKNNYITKIIYMKDKKNDIFELENIKFNKTRIYIDNSIRISNLQPLHMAIRTLEQAIRYINNKDIGIHTEYYTKYLESLILKDRNKLY